MRERADGFLMAKIGSCQYGCILVEGVLNSFWTISVNVNVMAADAGADVLSGVFVLSITSVVDLFELEL
jgi:hypothetical protein